MSGSRVPLSWVSGNVVYARHMRDPWAVFVLGTESHDNASPADRLHAFDEMRSLLVELEADAQLLRVHRWWDSESYARAQTQGASPHDRARAAYLAEQAAELADSAAAPMVVLCVSLTPARAHVAEKAGDALADPAGQLGQARRVLRSVGLGRNARCQADVDADHDNAEELLTRLVGCIPDARPASLAEVEWLVRRAWTRGLGEPEVDGLDAPRALVFERNGRSVLKPRSVDVLGWADYTHCGYRQLQCEGELGTSYQAGLIACTMPADAPEGARSLELLFGPQDRLGFPIDLAVCSRYVTPARAAKQVDAQRARVDEAAREEQLAARGASDQALVRSDIARDAEAYLTGGLPLHEITLSVLVSAADEHTLNSRVKDAISCFRSYGVRLRLPVGQQLEVFLEQLPGQRTWTRGYVRRVTSDQLAAMAPRAAHRLGGRHGYAWGTTGPPGCSTIARWCPRDGSRLNTAAGVLLVGDSGSGKTTAAGKLTTEAFLDGAVIFDFTGKADDHHWHTAPLIAKHTDTIALDSDRQAWRGLLDPWLNAPAELRRDAALDFLSALLPRGASAEWQTKLLIAVDAVNDRTSAACNAEVLTALEQAGDLTSAAVAEHLRAQTGSGLAQLGFADLRVGRVRQPGGRQVTHVQLENLPVPKRGASRSDYDELERQGSALAKLVALLGLGVLARHPEQVKVFNFDEVKVLLDHEAGRRILDQLQRLGRSKEAIPVLQTQYASDIGLDRDSIGGLFGTVMCFRAPSEEEAVRSLELIGRKPTPRLVRDLQGASSGRALVRDHRGQVEWLQVTLPDTLRRRVETNPFARQEARNGAG